MRSQKELTDKEKASSKYMAEMQNEVIDTLKIELSE